MGTCTVGVVCSIGVGKARGGRSRNEDNYLVCDNGRASWRDGDAEAHEASDGEGTLVAVCDGMGGHQDGEVASTTASRVLAKIWKPGRPEDPARAMRRYILESHKRLHWRARETGPVTMGTTLTAAWVVEGHAAWCHVGDSRLYLFRGGQLTRVSSDQTRNEFARRDGRPSPSEGHHLAQNFIYGSRGLGDDSSLRIEQGLDAAMFDVEVGDRLLLCTDGLSGVVDDVSIADVLRNTPDPQPAASALLDRALARGATDNITIIVMRVDQGPTQRISSPSWDEDDDDSTGFFE